MSSGQPDLLDPTSWFLPDLLSEAQKRFSLLPGGRPDSVEDFAAVLLLSAFSDDAARVRMCRLGHASLTFSPERREALARHLAVRWNVGAPNPDDPFVFAPDWRESPEMQRRILALWDMVLDRRQVEARDNEVLLQQVLALLPDGLRPDPHQVDAVRYFLASGRLLLADEMGLGKTVVALCSILALLDRGPFPVLVVCPLSMPYTWEREARRWLSEGVRRRGLPALDVVVLTSARSFERDLPAAHARSTSKVFVTTYDQASIHKNEIIKLGAKFFISDESHYLKTFDSQRTRAAMEIRRPATWRLLLSGTPMTNGRPAEIYSQIRMLDPHAFEDYFHVQNPYKSFMHRFCGPAFFKRNGRTITTYNGRSNEAELGVALAPYLLRRTKVEVGMKLGEKVRYRVDLKMTPSDCSRVETLRQQVASKIRTRFEAEVSRLVSRGFGVDVAQERAEMGLASEAMEQMTATRILVGKIKAEASIPLLEDLIEEEHRIVVFTAHHDVADLATHLYRNRFGTPRVLQCSSSMVGRDRDREIQRALSSSAPILVLPRAYREGITLIEFDRLVMLERWWVSGEEAQAEDRIHRRGQEKDVAIYYPHLLDSSDDAMSEVLTWKEEGQQTMCGAAEKRLFQWLLQQPETTDGEA